MILRLAIPLLAALAPAAIARAEPLTFGGGVAVTTDHLSDGLSDTGGRPAVVPRIEAAAGGFYLGAEAFNLSDEDGNRARLDLMAGYRGEAAPGLGYELGYTRTILNRTGLDASELHAAADLALSDRATVGAEVAYDLATRTAGEALGLEYGLAEAWTLHAGMGLAAPRADIDRSLGVAYAIDERTIVDLQVADTAATRPLFALTLDHAFGAPGE